MFNVITIGGATRDITFVTNKCKIIKTPENLMEQTLIAFEYGAKIRSEEVYFNFGGGACNTAATLAELGIKASAHCRVGNDDNRKAVVKNLKQRGVNTKLIQTDNEKQTGFSLVVVKKGSEGGDRAIFVYRGASDRLVVNEQNINKTKWIYLTSLAQDWEKDLDVICKSVRENKIKLMWNPGGYQIASGRGRLEKYLRDTEILLLNKDEAIELVQGNGEKLEYNDANNPAVLLKIILKWGPKMAIVTDGENGAYLYNGGDHVVYSPAAKAVKIDTTGAGDAFGAAFLGGLILNDDIEIALKYGIINSASVIEKYGAQNGILKKEEVEKRMGEIKVSYL